jgi:cadmium resistance protein CadD (predicted permease)
MRYLKKVMMPHRHPVLAALIDSDVSALRIAIAIGAMLFGTGLLVSDMAVDSAAYVRMFYLAPAWVWACAFFTYAAGKFYIAIYWPDRIPKSLAASIITLGLFLWSYVYLSFVADGQSPAEYMMSSLIICEIWIGAHTMAGGRSAHGT